MDNVMRKFRINGNYVDEGNSYNIVLAEGLFSIFSTFHTTINKLTEKVVFWKDIILPIEHILNKNLVQ